MANFLNIGKNLYPPKAPYPYSFPDAQQYKGATVKDGSFKG